MRSVAFLPTFFSLLTCQLVSAAEHLRAAQITAAPDPRKLLVRQNDQCPNAWTVCPDGNGCCPNGEPCITRANGGLGCGGGCDGGPVCPDGGCCLIGSTCTLSSSHYFCASGGSGPIFTGLPSVPHISVTFTGIVPSVTVGPPSPTATNPGGPGAGSSSEMVPTGMSSSFPIPGTSSSLVGNGSGGVSSGVVSSPSAEQPPSSVQAPSGSLTGSATSSSLAVNTNLASQVDVPAVSWLALLAGAFLQAL